MRKIVNYCICWVANVVDLDNEVKKLIKRGWEPFGSAIYDHKSAESGGLLVWGHGLVKYEDKEEVAQPKITKQLDGIFTIQELELIIKEMKRVDAQ